MSEWPIIKQITMLMAFVINFIYSVLSIIGIENVIVTVVLMTVLFKLMTLPITINQQKASIINKLISPELKQLKNQYGNIDSPIFKAKANIELEKIRYKYSVPKSSGCLMFALQFPVIIGLYCVIYNIEKFIPGLPIQAFDFCGLNLKATSGFRFGKELIIPIIVFISQMMQTLIMQKVNTGKWKIDFGNIFSAGISFYFAISVPLLIGVYWTLQSLFSGIEIYVIHFVLRNKDIGYFTKKQAIKHCKYRKKRGLPVSSTLAKCEV